MSCRVFGRAVLVCLALAGVTSSQVQAQWQPIASRKLPRTGTGAIDLRAAAPRAADGKPDLSGVWEQYGEFDFPRFLLDITSGLKPGDVVMQPWAADLYAQRRETNSVDHPGARCLPSGIPEKNAVPAPMKVVQTPELTVILYESRTIFRQVFTDGRSHPVDPVPTWMGYSVGRWDGDTFVVDTKGFNGKTWLDMNGHPATEALQVTERFVRRDVGRLDLQMTVNDLKAYTKPFTVSQSFHLLPDGELIEHICEENNKDLQHMVGK